MNEIKILELDKILSLLSERCVSEPAKEKALTLLPFESIEKCRASLEETDAAYVLYKKFSAPSFSGLSDISAILKKAERGAILSILRFSENRKSIKNLPTARRILRRPRHRGRSYEIS